MSIKISSSTANTLPTVEYSAQRETQLSEYKAKGETGAPIKPMAIRSLATLSSASAYAYPTTVSKPVKGGAPNQIDTSAVASPPRAIPMRTMSSVVRTTIASAYQMRSAPPSDYLGIRRQATSASVVQPGGTLKKIDEVSVTDSSSEHYKTGQILSTVKSSSFLPHSSTAASTGVSVGSLRRFKDSPDNLLPLKAYTGDSSGSRVLKKTGILDCKSLDDTSSYNIKSSSGVRFYSSLANQTQLTASKPVFSSGQITQHSIPTSPSVSVAAATGQKTAPSTTTLHKVGQAYKETNAVVSPSLGLDEQHKIKQRYITPYKRVETTGATTASLQQQPSLTKTEILSGSITASAGSATTNPVRLKTHIPSFQIGPGQSLSSLHNTFSALHNQKENHSWTTRLSSGIPSNELTVQSARTFGELGSPSMALCNKISKATTASSSLTLVNNTLENKMKFHSVGTSVTDTNYLILHMPKDSIEKLIQNLQTLSSTLGYMKPLTERLEKDIFTSSGIIDTTQLTSLKLTDAEIEGVKNLIKSSDSLDTDNSGKPLDNIQKLIKSVSDQLSCFLSKSFSTNSSVQQQQQLPINTNEEKKEIQTTTDILKYQPKILSSRNDVSSPSLTETLKNNQQASNNTFLPMLAPLDKVKQLNKLAGKATDELLNKSLKLLQDNQQDQFSLQREYMYSLQIEAAADGAKFSRCIDVIKIYTSPNIFLMMEFLTVQECKEVKEQDGQAEQNSTEETICQLLRRRLAAILKLDTEDVGEFKLVECKTNELTFQHSLPYKNTCALIYLNDVPTGGTLKFETLRLQVLPRCGTAIVWQNTKEDQTDLKSSVAIPSIPTHVIICELKNFSINNQQGSPEEKTKSVKDFSLTNFKLNTHKSLKLPKALRRRRSVENTGAEQSLFKLQTVEEEDRSGI